jgi:hypothetical protein
MTSQETIDNSAILPQPQVPEQNAPSKMPKGPETVQAEVTLPGQPPTKVTVTAVDRAPDGKEATVRVRVSEGKPAEGAEAPSLAPLLFVAAVAALVLVTSKGSPTGPSPQ